MPVEDCDTIAPKGVAINKNKKSPSVERNENNNYIEEKIVIYSLVKGWERVPIVILTRI